LLDGVLLLHSAKRFTFSGHIADDRWEVELPVVGSLAGELDAARLEMKVVVLKFGAQVDASLEAYLLLRNTPGLRLVYTSDLRRAFLHFQIDSQGKG